MKQLSVDLRELLLRATDAGSVVAEAARLAGVGESTTSRWCGRRWATGSSVPWPGPRRSLPIGLRGASPAAPDATLAECCEAGERAAGPTRLVAQNQALRAAELGAAERAARPCAPQRAGGRVPRNYGRNGTLFSARTPGGIGPANVVEGAADGETFAFHVREPLAPSLHPGAGRVRDNLGAHKGTAIRELVEGVGRRPLFLPVYSRSSTQFSTPSKTSNSCAGPSRGRSARPCRPSER